MFFREGPGDVDQRRGHPGALFEIEARAESETLVIWALVLQGRQALRTLVYSTDSRLEFRDLPCSTKERDEPWSQVPFRLLLVDPSELAWSRACDMLLGIYWKVMSTQKAVPCKWQAAGTCLTIQSAQWS